MSSIEAGPMLDEYLANEAGDTEIRAALSVNMLRRGIEICRDPAREELEDLRRLFKAYDALQEQVDAWRKASGLWTHSDELAQPDDLDGYIVHLKGHRDAAADILQTLLQEPLGSDKARKALDMAGAWLVAIAKEGA